MFIDLQKYDKLITFTTYVWLSYVLHSGQAMSIEQPWSGVHSIMSLSLRVITSLVRDITINALGFLHL